MSVFAIRAPRLHVSARVAVGLFLSTNASSSRTRSCVDDLVRVGSTAAWLGATTTTGGLTVEVIRWQQP